MRYRQIDQGRQTREAETWRMMMMMVQEKEEKQFVKV